MNECMDEMHSRTKLGEWMNEHVNKRANEQTNGRIDEYMNDQN